MKLQAILQLLVGLSALSAFAAEVPSSLYYQPKAGANSLEASYLLLAGSTEAKVSGVKQADAKYTSAVLELTYLYGVSEGMALGISINTGLNQVNITPVGGSESEIKYKGLGDIDLKYLGLSNMGQFNLRYGMSLGLSPGNEKSATTTIDGNRYSGGHSLAPYVALEMGDSQLHYGLGMSYTYFMTRKTDSATTPTTTEETTGGHALGLAPYIEMMAGPGLLSGQLSYVSMAKMTTKDDQGVSTDKEAGTAIVLNASYSYDFNSTFNLTGSVGYGSIPYYATGYDKATMGVLSTGILGRMTF